MSNEQPTCPLCGGEVLKQPMYDGWEWECQNISCGATFIFNRKLTESEAIARFKQRPESAWEMFRRLWKTYGFQFCIELNKKRGVFKDAAKEKTKTLIMHLKEDTAKERMSEIEKDLKGE